MFNSIVIKINILSSLTEIRHTDVKDFLRKSCLFTLQSPDGDSPVGACGSAALHRHLRCFGSLTETSLTFRCGPDVSLPWHC